jgi:hydroxypyruvate isomerase
MKRRDFSLAAAGALTAGVAGTVRADHRQSGEGADAGEVEPGRKFQLQYAPHFNHFKHHAGKGYLDQLKFAAEVGFTAWEDNGMLGRPVEQQEQIAALMEERGMTTGAFVGYASFNHATFADPTNESRAMLKKRMEMILKCAKRVNATWTTIIPGTFVHHLEWDEQTAKVVETLKMCAEILEPAGVVMILNPWANSPGCFLSKAPQAVQICKAVNSPSCKILDDLSHQQSREGNLLSNIDHAYNEIAYFQAGAHPGRQEAGSGAINFRNVFQHIHGKGFRGVVGMEHGNSKKGIEGELALIQAYRDADNFQSI